MGAHSLAPRTRVGLLTATTAAIPASEAPPRPSASPSLAPWPPSPTPSSGRVAQAFDLAGITDTGGNGVGVKRGPPADHIPHWTNKRRNSIVSLAARGFRGHSCDVCLQLATPLS